MATVTGNALGSTWMELSWYWPTSESQLAGVSGQSNQIAIYMTSGSHINYNGSFDLYSGTGTITSIDIYLGNSLSFTASGLSYSLSTWFNSEFNQDLPYVLSGADTITGSTVYPNYLMGFAGSDTLTGGINNDILDGGDGADTMNGGAGNDVYYVNTDSDVIVDSGGTDTIYYTGGGSLVMPTGIENLVSTNFGFIDGNAGDNLIVANSPTWNSFLDGKDGNDTLYGNAWQDNLTGNAGNDTLYGGAQDDWLEGETGNDPFAGVAGDDLIYGEGGNDTVLAGGGNDTIYGGAGTDALVGEDGNDVIFGGSEWDLMDGRDGADMMFGEGGGDIIFGDAGEDAIDGGDGDDLIMGERGYDSLIGDSDTIVGGAGNDMLDGSAGDDMLMGGVGNDIIDGDEGNDRIIGGPGAEIIAGTDYNHVSGRDTFVYESVGDAGDWIYGFRAVAGDSDKIELVGIFNSAGYAGTTPRTDGYLMIQQSGGNTQIYVDANGPAGGANWVNLLNLYQTTLDPSALDSYFIYQ